MSTQRLVFAFLFGLLMTFCGGCGGGTGGTGVTGGGDDSSKDGGNSTKDGANTKKKAGKPVSAKVWIDNYTPKCCAVTVDGESKGTLEPFACQFLDIVPGAHTFVLTCEGQPAETTSVDIAAGKLALVRPTETPSVPLTGSRDYLTTTLQHTSMVDDQRVDTLLERPAPREGVVIADAGPFDVFPPASSGAEEGASKTSMRIVRSLPKDMDLAELEHFIYGDYRLYGITGAEGHRKSVISRLKQMEPFWNDPKVCDMGIRALDRLAVCAAGNNDSIAISDALLQHLPPKLERIPDDKLIGWLGLDPQTGKARVLPEGQQINPSIAAAAVSLLLQRGKQQQVLDCFPALPGDAARAVVAILANPPTPDELRRRVVVLGLQRPLAGILKEACTALADKDFVPDEEMVEALTATVDQLNPDEGDNRATIKHCSSCLVDAFYRHPAVVAREKTRRFLVRFAHPGLEPTLENARYALIDGRCANDLVPIYTHFTRDVRIEMVGRLVTACQKREAVGQDIIDLYRVSLADEDTSVRITAAKALPQLAAFLTQDNLSAFQDLLVRALNDPSVDVQREATRALEVNGFAPTEQIANHLVAVWSQLDSSDPQGQANRDQLAKALKTSFEKNPGVEADNVWRERALAALAK